MRFSRSRSQQKWMARSGGQTRAAVGLSSPARGLSRRRSSPPPRSLDRDPPLLPVLGSFASSRLRSHRYALAAPVLQPPPHPAGNQQNRPPFKDPPVQQPAEERSIKTRKCRQQFTLQRRHSRKCQADRYDCILARKRAVLAACHVTSPSHELIAA